MQLQSFLLFLSLLTLSASADYPDLWGTFHTKTHTIGPIEVVPRDMTHGFIPYPLPEPANFAWTELSVRLTDEEDKDIPPTTVYFHHVLIGSWNRSEVMCVGRHGESLPFSYVGGAGSDFTPTKLSYPFAYTVGPSGEFWSAAYHLLSNVDTVTNVFLKVTFKYVVFTPGRPLPVDLLPVETIWFDVGTTQGVCISSYSVPKGDKGFSIKTLTIKSPFEGTLAHAMGHLHPGGRQLILNHNNDIACDSVPQYMEGDLSDYLKSVGVCSDMNRRVRIGDTFEIVSVYSDAKPIDEAMGIFLAYAHVTKRVPLEWRPEGDDKPDKDKDKDKDDEDDEDEDLEDYLENPFNILSIFTFLCAFGACAMVTGLAIWFKRIGLLRKRSKPYKSLELSSI